MNPTKMRKNLLRQVPDQLVIRINRWELEDDPTFAEVRMTEWMKMVTEKYENSPNIRFDISTDFLIDYNQQLFFGRVRFVPAGLERVFYGRH